jgi:acyl carrier protein
LEELKGYIAHKILDGNDIGLEEWTPLLEWGIINSIEIAKLMIFIQINFCVEIPNEAILPKHFKDIASLTNLVFDLVKKGPAKLHSSEAEGLDVANEVKKSI